MPQSQSFPFSIGEYVAIEYHMVPGRHYGAVIDASYNRLVVRIKDPQGTFDEVPFRQDRRGVWRSLFGRAVAITPVSLTGIVAESIVDAEIRHTATQQRALATALRMTFEAMDSAPAKTTLLPLPEVL